MKKKKSQIDHNPENDYQNFLHTLINKYNKPINNNYDPYFPNHSFKNKNYNTLNPYQSNDQQYIHYENFNHNTPSKHEFQQNYNKKSNTKKMHANNDYDSHFPNHSFENQNYNANLNSNSYFN